MFRRGGGELASRHFPPLLRRLLSTFQPLERGRLSATRAFSLFPSIPTRAEVDVPPLNEGEPRLRRRGSRRVNGYDNCRWESPCRLHPKRGTSAVAELGSARGLGGARRAGGSALRRRSRPHARRAGSKTEAARPRRDGRR